MVATVSSSTYLVATGYHGNIILEGVVLKLDNLKKLSAFTLAQMNVNEDLLPKCLRLSVEEMQQFLRKT